MASSYLPKARYVAALLRLRAIVASGVKLVADDDTTPGNKSTTCTWGLCSEEKDAWPDAEDHLWPDQFRKDGRVAPRYLRDAHLCPVDAREVVTAKGHSLMQGCFYTCRIFNAKRTAQPSREQVIQWYDKRIAEHTKGDGS